MSEFKWRHFSGEIILQCVRWYCKYGISYRDLEEMMADLEWDELEKALESIRHELHPTPPKQPSRKAAVLRDSPTRLDSAVTAPGDS